LVQPVEPDPVYVGFVQGSAIGEVCTHGNGDEFCGDAIVLQRMVQRASVGDWDASVAGVVQDQRGCSDGTRVNSERDLKRDERE